MELIDVKGLGKTRVEKLNAGGIKSPEDLLNHLPKKYYDFSNCDAFVADNFCHLYCVRLVSDCKTVRVKTGLNFSTAKATETRSGEALTLVWYGQTYVAQTLKNGQKVYVYGKLSPTKKGQFIVSMHKAFDKAPNGLMAVYKTFESVGQATISSSVGHILESGGFDGVLSDNISKKIGELTLNEAYFGVHFPKNLSELERAQTRLALEKGLIFAHKNFERKIYEKQRRAREYKDFKACLDEYKELLPFELTEQQLEAINDINLDLAGTTTLNRMIQGDVGCGKTVVALWGMFLSAKNGFQSVMMAPTEILAQQHYSLAKRLFEGQNFGVALLTSSLSKSEKIEVCRGVMSGEILMVFGTQSVLSDDVIYPKLQLVVADEQHRFGVRERAKLAGKGTGIDTLTMSATPIPRSVSLVLYGGLDITRICSRPHPANIQTNLIVKSKERDMWNFVGAEMAKGRTCYVVCPKIDDEEERDALVSTSAKTKQLKEIFGDVVAELNGRMKDDKKAAILSAFKSGEIKVLVSTTVVEVGVDCQNAGVIVIVNPDRFGLATLHQLRGRVGRDGQKSYCFCLLGDGVSREAGARLMFFKDNLNGFDIADFDLKVRGAGEAYGTRQHGVSDGLIPVDLSTYERACLIYNEFRCDTDFLNRVREKAQKDFEKEMTNIIMN